ncbi:MAG TPA: mitofilin family membrane protein [Micropepsaceae bacterium]
MSETQSASTPRPEREGPSSAPSPAPQPGAAAKSGRGRRFSGFLAIAGLMLLAGAATLTVERLRSDHVLATNLAEISRDLAALKSTVEALNARTGVLEHSASEVQAADTQLAGLAMRLSVLEADLGSGADRDTLAQLQDRIARLESRSPDEMLKTAATALARANLARAAEGDAPLNAELEALRTVDPDDPALGPLQVAADNGVATRATLAAAFPEAARAALDAAYRGEETGNFVRRLWASMRRLISVRRVGDTAGLTTEDRLARAQADLDRGGLVGAVTEVRGVGGAAAGALAPWLKTAEARITQDRAVAEMNARIVETLAAPRP